VRQAGEELAEHRIKVVGVINEQGMANIVKDFEA
jgi:hypothetical protein